MTTLRAIAAASAAALAGAMRLAPASDNPFVTHPLPLQEGRRLLAEGRVGDASLAFEAAAQVCAVGTLRHILSTPSNWWRRQTMRRPRADPAAVAFLCTINTSDTRHGATQQTD